MFLFCPWAFGGEAKFYGIERQNDKRQLSLYKPEWKPIWLPWLELLTNVAYNTLHAVTSLLQNLPLNHVQRPDLRSSANLGYAYNVPSGLLIHNFPSVQPQDIDPVCNVHFKYWQKTFNNLHFWLSAWMYSTSEFIIHSCEGTHAKRRGTSQRVSTISFQNWCGSNMCWIPLHQ